MDSAPSTSVDFDEKDYDLSHNQRYSLFHVSCCHLQCRDAASSNESLPPSGLNLLCSRPTTDTRMFCVPGLCSEAQPLTRWHERDRHIWVCGPPLAVTGCFGPRACQQSGWVSAKAQRPAGVIFKPGGVGRARDGSRDDNIVFFTLRESLQWYEPDGSRQMRVSEAISGWVQENVSAQC